MQTRPNMQGSEMSPKGKVTLAGILTKTQATPPTRKSMAEVTRQTWVFLEVSNLLRQERSMPGKMTEVIGSHAHFWLQVGLMVGNCSQMGKLQSFRKRLLYDCPRMTQMTITTTSSKVIVVRKATPAIFSEVNLRILVRPTQMQMLRMSLRIMLLSEKSQPSVKPRPTRRERAYMVLNSKVWTRNKTMVRNLALRRKRSQLVQIPMQSIPRTKLTMYRQIVMPISDSAATTAPNPSKMKKTRISQQLTSIALPPSDHGREYMATTATMMVTRRIQRISPHYRVLGEKVCLQQTQQERVAAKGVAEEARLSWRMSKQLLQWMGSLQLFVMGMVQPGGRHWLAPSVGERVLYLVVRPRVMGTPVVMTMQVGVLLARDQSDWLYVQMQGSEQSRKGELRRKSGAGRLLVTMGMGVDEEGDVKFALRVGAVRGMIKERRDRRVSVFVRWGGRIVVRQLSLQQQPLSHIIRHACESKSIILQCISPIIKPLSLPNHILYPQLQ